MISSDAAGLTRLSGAQRWFIGFQRHLDSNVKILEIFIFFKRAPLSALSSW